MKNIFKIIVTILITMGFLYADPVAQSGEKDGYDVKLSSEKSLIVGSNDLIIDLSNEPTSL